MTLANDKPSFHQALAEHKLARLEPPVDLPDEQRQIWNETVNALPADWFATEHIQMLKLYCQHLYRAAKLEAALSRVDPLMQLNDYEKLVKLAGLESAKVLSLARAMRLTQQSRLKPETAANRSAAAAHGFGVDVAKKHNDLLA